MRACVLLLSWTDLRLFRSELLFLLLLFLNLVVGRHCVERGLGGAPPAPLLVQLEGSFTLLIVEAEPAEEFLTLGMLVVLLLVAGGAAIPALVFEGGEARRFDSEHAKLLQPLDLINELAKVRKDNGLEVHQQPVVHLEGVVRLDVCGEPWVEFLQDSEKGQVLLDEAKLLVGR